MLKIHFIQFVNGHSINDGDPPWLIIIYFFLGVTMTTNLPSLSSFFFFFPSSVTDDSEPKGLSSFLSFFLRCRKWRWAERLIVSSWFFSSNARDDNELGGSQFIIISWVLSQVWAHWLHHHLMHHYYTFLYVGMSPPPNKCKGKEEKGSEVYNIWTGSWPKRTTPVMLVGISCVCWVFILFNL